MNVASRGSVGGVRVLSPGAWEKLHAEVTTANIFQVFPTHFRWIQHNIFTSYAYIFVHIQIFFSSAAKEAWRGSRRRRGRVWAGTGTGAGTATGAPCSSGTPSSG